MAIEYFDGTTAEDNFILEFSKMMRRNISQIIKESCQIACIVYHMHFIKQMSAKEIADDLKISEDFIDMYVQYYDQLLN